MRAPLASSFVFTDITARTARLLALTLALALRGAPSHAQTATSIDEPRNSAPPVAATQRLESIHRSAGVDNTVQVAAFKAAFDQFNEGWLYWGMPGLLGAITGAAAVGITLDDHALPDRTDRLTAAAVWAGAGVHALATYAMPARYQDHSLASASALVMSATATFGYLNAESNPTRVAFAAQIAGGARRAPRCPSTRSRRTTLPSRI